MKRGLAIIVFFASTAALGASETYKIDPAHTYPSLEFSHMGISVWRGKFDKTSGSITIDWSAKTGNVDIVVDAASIDFGLEALDTKAKSDDFFDAGKFPKLRYTGLIKFVGDEPTTVEGLLTIRDTTRPLKLVINKATCIQHPMYKKELCGADAQGELNWSEYGMRMSKFGQGDSGRVTLRIQVEALGDQPGPTAARTVKRESSNGVRTEQSDSTARVEPAKAHSASAPEPRVMTSNSAGTVLVMAHYQADGPIKICIATGSTLSTTRVTIRENCEILNSPDRFQAGTVQQRECDNGGWWAFVVGQRQDGGDSQVASGHCGAKTRDEAIASSLRGFYDLRGAQNQSRDLYFGLSDSRFGDDERGGGNINGSMGFCEQTDPQLGNPEVTSMTNRWNCGAPYPW